METTLIDVVDRDGLRSVPAAWLRMHCPCDSCMLVDIGERRVLLTSPREWIGDCVEHRDLATTVTWASGHVSTYDAGFVTAMEAKAHRRRWTPVLWAGGHAVAEIDHDSFMTDPDARVDALLRYRAEGVLVLRDVPTTGIPSEDFLDSIRIPIWEGPFGLRSIDTRVQAVAYNVAETAEALPPHTDLAGYQWPPSGQMLHMLVNEAEGGDSLVVDGWRVLAEFRADHPAGFDVLTQVPVAHRIFSEDRETYARAPLVRLDTTGAVNGVPIQQPDPAAAPARRASDARVVRRLHRAGPPNLRPEPGCDLPLGERRRIPHPRPPGVARAHGLLRDRRSLYP